jgi:hypothetical protein
MFGVGYGLPRQRRHKVKKTVRPELRNAIEELVLVITETLNGQHRSGNYFGPIRNREQARMAEGTRLRTLLAVPHKVNAQPDPTDPIAYLSHALQSVHKAIKLSKAGSPSCWEPLLDHSMYRISREVKDYDKDYPKKTNIPPKEFETARFRPVPTELLRGLLRAVGSTMRVPTPRAPTPEPISTPTLETPTIWYHGNQSYSADGTNHRNTSRECHNLLKQFLDRDVSLDTRSLEDSGVNNVARVADRIASLFGDVYIRRPENKGDGYFIRVCSKPTVPTK